MWYKLPNLLIFFLLLVTTSSAASPKFDFHTSYDRHCGSILPQATLKGFVLGSAYQEHRHTGYYTGAGSGILSPGPSYKVQNSLELYTYFIRETNKQGLFSLQGRLRLLSGNSFQMVGNSTSVPGGSFQRMGASIHFSLKGFWSPSSGKVCMVGSRFGYSKRESYLHQIHPVLELSNFVNSSSVSTLISGTLQSWNEDDANDSGGEPVSLLMFPSINNYQYTLVSNQSEKMSSGLDSTSSLKIERFCSVLSRVLNNDLDLKYPNRCASAKNCTPLDVSAGLPGVVSIKSVDCSDDTRSLRVVVEFANSTNDWYRRPFNPNTTLVGEGLWEAKKNQLSIVACRFLDAAASWGDARVGDCSTRLSLRFPAALTIGDTSIFVGQIWTNKSATDLGYFEKIAFESSEDDIERGSMPGLKYEYTKTDIVTKLCPRKEAPPHGKKKKSYPMPSSYDMRFDVSATTSTGKEVWGSCAPLSVGDKFYQPRWYYSTREESLFSTSDQYSLSAPVSPPVVWSNNQSSRYNVSYKINIKQLSISKLGNASVVDEMQISAEGIYDARDGSLCMVGCRNLGSKSQQQPTNHSVDCEIVVNFQFPPLNSGTRIKGSMKSTRDKSDPLHFESWEFSSAAVYLIEERRSIWRMDVEITLVLISTTLACVFGGLQLLYVKKNPDSVPSISILMLLILALGYMIPLMLNFEAMFTNSPHRQNVFLGSGGWLEVNEVIVRVTTMVAFLLQIRLLQLTWSARSASGTKKELWLMEKKALFVALPAYAAGAFVAFLVHRQIWSKRHSYGAMTSYPEHSILGTSLKSYAGLVLDGFLLPQILLNMLCNSKDKSLSVSFYVGTTFIRVLPHAYDLYRAHHSAHNQLNGSYFYASPATDFYSTAWDVIIPFGGLLFAGAIFLQQKFGGLCILPRKLRDWGAYEKVPTVTEEE